MATRVAVIPGDGIGPEVIEAAIPVLEAAVETTRRGSAHVRPSPLVLALLP